LMHGVFREVSWKILDVVVGFVFALIPSIWCLLKIFEILQLFLTFCLVMLKSGNYVYKLHLESIFKQCVGMPNSSPRAWYRFDPFLATMFGSRVSSHGFVLCKRRLLGLRSLSVRL
jgi:hypothetical protein